MQTQDHISTPESDKFPTGQGQIAWLDERLKYGILYMSQKSRQRSRRASFLRLAATAMSAAAAIALGVQIVGADQVLRNLAFVLVTLVTLINALEPFFNFRALWVEHETASAGFHRVRDHLHFYLTGLKEGEQPDPARIRQFYLDFRKVWDEHNSAWITHRRSDESLKTPLV